MRIHSDIQAVIFAYCGLWRIPDLRGISRNSQKLCSSHTYIISFGENTLRLAIYAGQYGWYELVKNCLAMPDFDPGQNQNQLIRCCSADASVTIMKLFLADQRINPADYYNMAIRCSASAGNFAICQLLAADPRVYSHECFKYCLSNACAYGHLELARFLLGHPASDPTFFYNDALVKTCRNGHLEIVKLLVGDGRIDMSHQVRINNAMNEAVMGGHDQIVAFLMAHP